MVKRKHHYFWPNTTVGSRVPVTKAFFDAMLLSVSPHTPIFLLLCSLPWLCCSSWNSLSTHLSQGLFLAFLSLEIPMISSPIVPQLDNFWKPLLISLHFSILQVLSPFPVCLCLLILFPPHFLLLFYSELFVIHPFSMSSCLEKCRCSKCTRYCLLSSILCCKSSTDPDTFIAVCGMDSGTDPWMNHEPLQS